MTAANTATSATHAIGAPSNPASARRFVAWARSPSLRREVGDLPVGLAILVGVRQFAAEEGAQVGAERDLKDGRRRRVLAEHVPDRPLGVEERTERTAREDAVGEAEAAGAVHPQLRGGTPAHLLRVVGGDGLIALPHLRRAPVAHAPEQGCEGGVGGGVRPEQEGRPVAAGRELAALVGAALRLGHRLAEALRARRTELDREAALHHTTLINEAGTPACAKSLAVEKATSFLMRS